MPGLPTVGILADDMTGALDSAARLTPLAGPIPLEILSQVPAPDLGSFSISSNTREAKSAAEAAGRVAQLATRLGSCDIAFKKVDSLLRGHPFAELAAVMAAGGYDRCLFAPAFPEQGRVTVDGQQWVVDADGQRRPIETELTALAEAHGLTAARAEDNLAREAAQVIIADAETSCDLSDAIRIVQSLGGKCLYCGTAGLAGALAHCKQPEFISPEEPILAIVGSHHPVSRRQIEAARASLGVTTRGLGADPATQLMVSRNNRLIWFAFDPGTQPVEAQERIRAALRAALKTQPRPAGLLVVGGETVATVADLLEVERILAEGELAAGLPAGRIEGGPWNGVRLFSKSGAFGDADLVRRILFSETPDTREI